MTTDAERITEECDALKEMLLAKNRAYGSSALNPVRIFAKSDTVEQIRVRIDDTLSRLMRGSAAGEDVVKDLLGYLILLRIATRKQASDIPEAFLKASREAPSIVDVLSDPNGPASKPLFPPGVGSYAALRDVLDREPLREDVGFALTDAEAAEAERAVDAEWGGAIRRKLGIARGKLDGVADDLEEVGGWEETVKEIRQTLNETADPNYVAKLAPDEERRGVRLDCHICRALREMPGTTAVCAHHATLSTLENTGKDPRP